MAKYEYLKWCIEVAKADFAEIKSIQSLAKIAMEKGFLLNDKDIAEWCVQDQGPAIKENVIAFATANTGSEQFSIDIKIKDGHRQFSKNRLTPLTYNGTIKFLRSNPKHSTKAQNAEKRRLKKIAVERPVSDTWVETMLDSWKERQKRVSGLPDDFRLNELVMQFYEMIYQYCQDKKFEIKDVPLRICKLDTCKRPFFGRLQKQQFCCKRHGEVWHAKQAYRKKTLKK